jgi:HEPN domain-containing protein
MTPASVLSISETFYRGYELCHGNGLPSSEGKPNAIIPSIVCLAFAIELALKSILVGVVKPSKGHELALLFKELPDDLQSEVIKGTGIPREEFLHQISIASKTFVEWRYIFEQNGLHSVDKVFLLTFYASAKRIAERYVELQRQSLIATSSSNDQKRSAGAD